MTTQNENDKIRFTVSGRELAKDTVLFSLASCYPFLKKYFHSTLIESVYSSVHERSPLYGGRRNDDFQSFTYEQVDKLNSVGIGLSLTLSNHFFTKEAYRRTIPILERINHSLNSVTIANDKLARYLRKDFPLLKRKASIIRKLLTKDEISNALELYDYVTLIPWLNDQPELLSSLEEKHRLIPFANATCLYKCRAIACYKHLSYCFINNIPFDMTHNDDPGIPEGCPNKGNKIKQTNVIFNIKDEHFKGYRLFKLVPVNYNIKPKVITYDRVTLP